VFITRKLTKIVFVGIPILRASTMLCKCPLVAYCMSMHFSVCVNTVTLNKSTSEVCGCVVLVVVFKGTLLILLFRLSQWI